MSFIILHAEHTGESRDFVELCKDRDDVTIIPYPECILRYPYIGMFPSVVIDVPAYYEDEISIPAINVPETSMEICKIIRNNDQLIVPKSHTVETDIILSTVVETYPARNEEARTIPGKNVEATVEMIGNPQSVQSILDRIEYVNNRAINNPPR